MLAAAIVAASSQLLPTSHKSRRRMSQSRHSDILWVVSMKPRIHPNEGKKFPPQPLTRHEVHRLLAAFSQRSRTGRRNKALVTVMYRAGLRVSETLNLDVKDFDQDAGTLRVLLGKGRKSRVVGVDSRTIGIINDWLEVRPPGEGPLFCSLGGRRLLPSYVRAMLPRIARRAGIAKRAHPHCLRHSAAYEMAGEGTPIHLIAQMLGHANVATTMTYISHLLPREVVEAMQGRKW